MPQFLRTRVAQNCSFAETPFIRYALQVVPFEALRAHSALLLKDTLIFFLGTLLADVSHCRDKSQVAKDKFNISLQ